jgi:queuine/archaeosine tRNA-ribosyltransferase
LDNNSIFLGYSFGRGNPRPWGLFEVPSLMVNAYDIIKQKVKIASIHDLLAYNGIVFCDSGGWQILQGKKDVDIYEIMDVQRRLDADLYAVLDDGLNEERHFTYLETYVKYADFDFVPVIPYDISKKGIEAIKQILDVPSIIGIGKLVPILKPPTDYVKLKIALRLIKQIKENFPGTKIHIFGVGGLYIALILFLFVDSIDTSSWLHDARFGKIRILGDSVYGTHPMQNNRHITGDYKCSCPICQKHSLKELDARGVIGMRLRAIHNAWVLNKELEMIHKKKMDGDYVEYVKDRIWNSKRHRYIFHLVSNWIEGDMR